MDRNLSAELFKDMFFFSQEGLFRYVLLKKRSNKYNLLTRSLLKIKFIIFLMIFWISLRALNHINFHENKYFRNELGPSSL